MRPPESSRDLDDLQGEMKQKVHDALDICKAQKVDMLVYCTHRS